MARKHEAVSWLKQGLPPSKIAEKMAVTASTVMQYLFNQVGEGKIRRSDIVFSIDEKTRRATESEIAEAKKDLDAVDICYRLHRKGNDVNEDDTKAYFDLRDARVSLGDMYEMVRDIELSWHTYIKDVLSRGFGTGAWWREGVPQRIRQQCVTSREADSEPAEDPFCYTNLIHLKEILEENWDKFRKILPVALAENRRALFANFVRLNCIRNCVMHPVKGKTPTEEDFKFVREFRKNLDPP